MTATVIHSAAIVDHGAVTDDAWVLFEHGRIAARGTGTPPPADESVDAAGRLLTPGFIDLHVHGGAGATFDEGAESVRAARLLHRAHGTTRSLLSLTTAPIDDLVSRLEAIAHVGDDLGILGAHLEGPFLSPRHRGAHPESWLRTPDAGAIDRLLGAAGLPIRQITIAPELPGGLEAIARITRAGIVAAVGHTSADAATSAAAFDAGATLLTHAFNAMPGIHHRSPGPLPVAFADHRVTVEIIADGVHIDPSVVRIAFASAEGGVALVTDAMAAAGAADGDYVLAGQAVRVQDRIARVVTDGSIAGSTLTQDHALRVAVDAGVPRPAAVTALTTAPAAVLGETGRFGTLDVGASADAVLLSEGLHVERVWASGAPV